MKTNYYVEVTDTFSGEPNYAWCHRYELPMPENATRLSIVRAAKKVMGWTGRPCVTTERGDAIELRMVGACVVAFIVVQYPPQEQLP